MSELQKLLDRIQVRGAYEALFCFQVDTDAINAEAAQAGLGPIFGQLTTGQRLVIFAPDDAGEAIIWTAEELQLLPSDGKLRWTVQRLNDWKQALTAPKAHRNPARPKGRPGRRGYSLEALAYAEKLRGKNPRMKAQELLQACRKKYHADDLPPDADNFRRWLNRPRANRAN
jgi:hypothetical protein